MREMKDSGIEWIGKIPAHWALSKVGMFYNIVLGKMLQSEQSSDSDTYEKYLCAMNLGNNALKYDVLKKMWFSEKERQQYKVQKGDLIVVEGGDVASCDIVKEDVSDLYIQNALHRVRAKKDFTLEFLRYSLMMAKAQGYISLICNKATIAHFTKDKFSSLPFLAVPVDEQLKIVQVLDKKCAQVDALITNIQTQIEKLKAYKQSMITEVVTKGLDPTVPMKDSGVEWIGEIPKHWSVIPSKFLFANCDERRREGDVQLTASQKYGMISQEEYMRRENARIVLADKGLENWKHVEPFDFVISLRSFQGGLEMSEVTGCATWHYIILRARQRIHPYYYKWLFKSSMYITTLQRTCNYIRDGQDLRYSNFVKVPLCIPTLYEQQKIADFLDRKCAKIDHLITLKQSKIEKLEQYKRSLIYEYVTGKREVSCDE
jgi:type I restriction enzyme S subunit